MRPKRVDPQSLARLLVRVIDAEFRVEEARQRLFSHPSFDPRIVFRSLDREGAGYLCPRDFSDFLEAQRMPMPLEDLERILKKYYRKSAWKEINFEAFLRFVSPRAMSLYPVDEKTFKRKDRMPVKLVSSVAEPLVLLLHREQELEKVKEEALARVMSGGSFPTRDIFDLLDYDKKGLLDIPGIEKFAREQNLALTLREVSGFIHRVDQDEKGYATLDDLDLFLFGEYTVRSKTIVDTTNVFNINHANTQPGHRRIDFYGHYGKPEEHEFISNLKELLQINNDVEVMKLALFERHADFSMDRAFRFFDTPNASWVGIAALEKALNRLGLFPSRLELGLLYRRLDTANIGSFRYKNFAELLSPRTEVKKKPEGIPIRDYGLKEEFSMPTSLLFGDIWRLLLQGERAAESARQNFELLKNQTLDDTYQALLRLGPVSVSPVQFKLLLEDYGIYMHRIPEEVASRSYIASPKRSSPSAGRIIRPY